MGRGEITESLVALVDHCKESGLGSKHEALAGGDGVLRGVGVII